MDISCRTFGFMHIATGPGSDRMAFGSQALELAGILHDWDPIGVYQGSAPNPDPTEYDDLVIPTLCLLRSGIGPARLTREFREALKLDYGLSHIPSTFGIARTCISWWKRRKSPTRD